MFNVCSLQGVALHPPAIGRRAANPAVATSAARVVYEAGGIVAAAGRAATFADCAKPRGVIGTHLIFCLIFKLFFMKKSYSRRGRSNSSSRRRGSSGRSRNTILVPRGGNRM